MLRMGVRCMGRAAQARVLRNEGWRTVVFYSCKADTFRYYSIRSIRSKKSGFSQVASVKPEPLPLFQNVWGVRTPETHTAFGMLSANPDSL